MDDVICIKVDAVALDVDLSYYYFEYTHKFCAYSCQPYSRYKPRVNNSPPLHTITSLSKAVWTLATAIQTDPDCGLHTGRTVRAGARSHVCVHARSSSTHANTNAVLRLNSNL